MTAVQVKKRKTAREKTTYMLSPELVKTVKLEAVELGVRPAHVVEARLVESFGRKPPATSGPFRPA